MIGLEVAVTSPAGVAAAAAGGANRVELSSALELGGLTPSQGAIEACVEGPLPVHVLVRCRPGDFVYDDSEIALVDREIAACVATGAAGVVFGALNSNGLLDHAVLRRWIETARSANPSTEVTIHRAIDEVRDPVGAVSALAGLGVDRVLTSGGAGSAFHGKETLALMVSAADGVQVMAGAGVGPHNIHVFTDIGLSAVHLSAKRAVPRRGGNGVRLGSCRQNLMATWILTGESSPRPEEPSMPPADL